MMVLLVEANLARSLGLARRFVNQMHAIGFQVQVNYFLLEQPVSYCIVLHINSLLWSKY